LILQNTFLNKSEIGFIEKTDSCAIISWMFVIFFSLSQFEVMPKKSHLTLSNLAKLVFWSVLSFKNWSFAKLLSFFASVYIVRRKSEDLRKKNSQNPYLNKVLPLTLLTRISFFRKMLNKSVIWVDTNSPSTTLWVIHSEIWENWWGLWQFYWGIFNFVKPNFITQGVGVQGGSWQWGTCPFRGR
jgi:hypothetical protein